MLLHRYEVNERAELLIEDSVRVPRLRPLHLAKRTQCALDKVLLLLELRIHCDFRVRTGRSFRRLNHFHQVIGHSLPRRKDARMHRTTHLGIVCTTVLVRQCAACGIAELPIQLRSRVVCPTNFRCRGRRGRSIFDDLLRQRTHTEPAHIVRISAMQKIPFTRFSTGGVGVGVGARVAHGSISTRHDKIIIVIKLAEVADNAVGRGLIDGRFKYLALSVLRRIDGCRVIHPSHFSWSCHGRTLWPGVGTHRGIRRIRLLLRSRRFLCGGRSLRAASAGSARRAAGSPLRHGTQKFLRHAVLRRRSQPRPENAPCVGHRRCRIILRCTVQNMRVDGRVSHKRIHRSVRPRHITGRSIGRPLHKHGRNAVAFLGFVGSGRVPVILNAGARFAHERRRLILNSHRESHGHLRPGVGTHRCVGARHGHILDSHGYRAAALCGNTVGQRVESRLRIVVRHGTIDADIPPGLCGDDVSWHGFLLVHHAWDVHCGLVRILVLRAVKPRKLRERPHVGTAKSVILREKGALARTVCRAQTRHVVHVTKYIVPSRVTVRLTIGTASIEGIQKVVLRAVRDTNIRHRCLVVLSCEARVEYGFVPCVLNLAGLHLVVLVQVIPVVLHRHPLALYITRQGTAERT
nr:MAG TPA: hypothetical protein [Caudoviricetes sp.]